MTRIPTHAALVRDFVNTVELDEADSDEIATPQGLAAWLASRALGPVVAGEADVERAAELRDALRALLMANNDLPVALDVARGVVEQTARESGIELRFDSEGLLLPSPTRSGGGAALGAIAAAVSRSMLDRSWTRLKACRAETCHFAFYDEARNRSRTWCSMESCGNRAKVRAYRRRHGSR